ncbi:phage tail protein [Peribacillus butanolivorans]|uniref:phage tail protein n=1 Tax=Peribacillus butanolivorans TaxID=421767 RepID=UPI00364D3A84
MGRLVNNDVSGTKTGSLTLEAALNHALKGSVFSCTKGIKALEQEGFGNQNSMSLLDEIIEDYKVELDVDNTKIYVYKKMGKKVKLFDGY